MKKKKLEEIIYDIKKEVSERFFAENPVKRFPEDFLTKKVKKELADIKNLPDLKLKPGKRITGRTHRDVRKKINLQKVMASYAYVKSLEAKMKYELVLLPGGKLKLKTNRKFEICSKSGKVLFEFDCYEKAKYVLYAGKKGQCIFLKVPKDEIAVKKAVQKYEKYLEEIKEKLVKAFAERVAEKTIAEGLAGQVFEELING